MNNPNIIVDSSVVLKWLFKDEQDAIHALTLQRNFARKIILISIPHLIFYEVNNVLKNSIKSKRIAIQDARIFYHAFIDLEFTVYSSKELFNKAFEKSIKLDISSYDASYIALAEYLQIPFYTADEKLIQKAAGKYVHHLSDYSLSS